MNKKISFRDVTLVLIEKNPYLNSPNLDPTFECNRCGKTYNFIPYNNFSIIRKYYGKNDARSVEKQLCPDCHKSFDSWLRDIKVKKVSI